MNRFCKFCTLTFWNIIRKFLVIEIVINSNVKGKRIGTIIRRAQVCIAIVNDRKTRIQAKSFVQILLVVLKRYVR